MLRAGQKEKGSLCFIFEGQARSVLLAARELIHQGWVLLGHPLYGNYRPNQQPYRSLLLKFDSRSVAASDGVERINADAASLHLIEEALLVYRDCHVLSPDDAPAVMREDCSCLDLELMRQTLVQSGWPEEYLGPRA